MKKHHRRCLTGFWIYHGSEFASGSAYIPGFWIYQGSKYVKVTKDSEYAWICPNNTLICLPMSEYAWMAFVLHVSIARPCPKEP